MTLHELKVWTSGFSAALGNKAPDKSQWDMLIEKIESAQDVSTALEDTSKVVVAPQAKKSQRTLIHGPTTI